MPDERSDRARAINESFVKDMNSLDSVNSYRQFVLKYFFDQDAKEVMLSIIGLADLSGRTLNEWHPFKRYFVHKAYLEFARKTASFVDEDVKLGFMSR
jgi:hypothetical protein